MKIKPILAALIALALVSMACSLGIRLPVTTDVKTGPTVTEEISIAVPEAADQVTNVDLSFGAGELRIVPGAEGSLIAGEARYNVEDLKPDVTVSGSSVRVETGNLEFNGIPSFGDKFVNEWDLEFGDTPMNLRISAGAYTGNFDLGGLALESLEITDGAATVDLDFSEPNPSEMGTLRYQTGASTVKMENLANANFSRLVFKSGAGSYTLDFNGDLKRDATVTIDSGVSTVNLIVPEGVAARVLFDGGLSNIDIGGGWQKSDNMYTQEGEGPVLTINVNMGAGTLILSN